MRLFWIFFLLGGIGLGSLSTRNPLPQFGEPFTQEQADELLAKQREANKKNLINLKDKLKE